MANKKAMKEYRIWKAMKSRCYSPSCEKVGYYQSDGIKVCGRWLHSFNNFLEDMGKIPGDDYSIERIDVHGDYCPDNCVWILMKDQSKNRRNCLMYTYNGETHCLKEWSRIIGMNYDTLRTRVIRKHIPFEAAISTPLRYSPSFRESEKAK